MKLENGNLITREDEQLFRYELVTALKTWFNINLVEFQNIIFKIVGRYETYQIKLVSKDDVNLRFKVQTEKKEELEIELFRGNMICPKCMFIYRDGKREVFH